MAPLALVQQPPARSTSNILQATFLAMRRAVTELAKQIKIDYCIVDGNQPIPHLDIAQSEVVKADASCYLVAAASIIAKVYRDSLMEHYDRYYPQYGFAKHKGYPTKSHIEALGRYGPSQSIDIPLPESREA